MSLREFITAIPKVDLNLQLTGALRLPSLLMMARQNGRPNQMEDFEDWVDLLERPDYSRLDEIAKVAGSWVMYPEDIALAVYDIGVALAKQNVPYAEIALAPSDFIGKANMNIEKFIAALNDGRDRARRGWPVDMAWIFCVPRDNPRAGDDVARWATGSSARRGNVVALGLLGQEESQPIGQFRRAFNTALKKDIFTVANAGSSLGAAGIRETLAELQAQRLTDSWGIADEPDCLAELAASRLPLVLSVTRALRLGLIQKAAQYPLKALVDGGLQVTLSAGLPSLYQTTLVDEYIIAHEECGLAIADIIDLARRSIALSFLDAKSKSALLQRFDAEVKVARAAFLRD